ncbi:transglycosylase domain-containing protein [Gorillibacterium massiliense]|uniref:transglycosylase domain-containing protein n=1 Tax=Gorillibacterium massiliense TaxID=1280390 RepID=UPI0004AC6C75|nr:PBP1A family penicillin-binding protein [Gorillibacterium massiliense]
MPTQRPPASGSRQPSQPRKTGSKGKPKKKGFHFKKLLTWLIVAAALAIVIGLIGYIFILFSGQKMMQENKDKEVMPQTSVIYDVNGDMVQKLNQGGAQNRELIGYDQLQPNLVNAFVATEDKRFWTHKGVDFWSIGRALAKDVVARSTVEGGSTITQQLAKNMYLTADKTFFRKGTEMSMALALENQFTKKEIMEMYLNRIFFGQNSWGVKAAAKTYFGKDISKPDEQLEIWEIATLAALPKAPTTYNPIKHPDNSKARRAVVLQLMMEQGYITKDEMEQAKAVDYVPPKGSSSSGSDTEAYFTFVDYVVTEAAEKYQIPEEELVTGGYKIYTTMDLKAQKTMSDTYDNDKFFQKDMAGEEMQSSMVILNNADSGIVAMIGGRDYAKKGFNRAVSATRSPGSSIKPLVVYGPAIEKGPYNAYSMLPDEKQDFNGYTPSNYDGKYEGQVDLAYAVKKSKNLPAVWLLNKIGVNYGKNFAKTLGIPFSSEDNNLAIALGGLTNGVSPLDMAQAYAAFPNNGVKRTAHSIVKIEDSNGSTVAEFSDKGVQAMKASTAWYMTQIMKGVVSSGGTGAKAAMDRPVAGKTGSTQVGIKGLEKYTKDLWFVGYTPEWTAAVWMGFDKTDKNHYITMSSGSAAAIFKEVMQKSLSGHKVVDFNRPNGVKDVEKKADAVQDLKAEYVPDMLKIRLTWTADKEATYKLYRKESQEEEFAQVAEITGEGSWYDTTVLPGGIYQYYLVTAGANGQDDSENSTTVEVEVPANSPSPGVTETPTETPGDGVTPTPSPGDGQTGGEGTASSSPGGGNEPTPTPTPPPQGGGTEQSGQPGGEATPTPTPSP